MAAIIAGPLISYFAATHQFSGTIEDSQASELWTESRSMRAEYQRTISEQRREIDELKREVGALRLEVKRLREESG